MVCFCISSTCNFVKNLIMNTSIDFGKVVLKILELLVVKIFTLPFTIWKNALVALSNADNDNSEGKVLNSDFPLFVWFVSIFNAIIALFYPIGIIWAVFMGTKSFMGGFVVFLGILASTYFAPLALGLIRESISITQKSLLYLKIISKK